MFKKSKILNILSFILIFTLIATGSLLKKVNADTTENSFKGGK